VMVDKTQMETVVVNLVANARAAMREGGELTLRAHNLQLAAAPSADLPAGDYVRLQVSDTGQGMAPEVVARAFEPFFTTKPIGEGTGLGLSQVYGIVRQLGGDVILDSRPSEGTTVNIYLPRAV
jgi:signal transduction histidine kinase